MITDALLIETGNGGDLVLRGNDLVTIKGYENSLYLSMFGGPAWWGNYLLKNKFQCKTEEALRTNALNSTGRVAIEQAVLSDISFLAGIPGTKYTASVTIAAVNRIDIEININGTLFSYQWNPDTLFLKYVV